MKKSLLFVAALSGVSALSSSALADSFGIRLGAPLGVQYTIDNGLGRNQDLRISGYVSPFFGVLIAGVQGDLLMDRPLGDNRDLSLFYGGGAHFDVVSGYGATAFGLGVQGTGGISYQLDRSISLFADVSLGVNFYTGNIAGYTGFGPSYGGAIGVNFKL